MATNYEDNERLQDEKEYGEGLVKDYEKDMNAAITANNNALSGINSTLEEGRAKLEASANEQTEFAISEIERQKEQAQKDYTKEQSGAYKDYQKQVDPYGANAEKMAANGLTNTGYAESSKVSMYNQYQARVTAARESFQRSIDNYNASITQARIQNNATLAQIAYDTLVKQAEYAATFAMKNTELLTTLATQKSAIKQQNRANYLSVYQQVIDEAQFDATLAENKRQHDAALAENKRQHDETLAFQREQFDWQKSQAEKSSSGSSGGSTINKSIQSKGQNKAIIKESSEIEKSSGSSGSNKTTSKSPEIDYDSLNALGLSGRSAEYINNMVEKGQLVEYEEDGKLKFKASVSSGFRGGR